jgi:RNA polymerase sigma-70 factor, ECF subfamily
VHEELLTGSGSSGEAVLARALAGDSRAATKIVRTHGARLYATALRILGDAQTAEEVVQDVFMQLFRGGSPFREESALSTWLFSVTLNRCRDRLRTASFLQNQTTVPVSEVIEDAAPTPGEMAERADRDERLQRALAEVAPEMKEILVLRFAAGLSYDAIAEVLGCPRCVARSRFDFGGFLMSQHVAELALLYCANELAESERAVVDQHLAVCPDCQNAFDAVQVAAAALASWSIESTALPPQLERRFAAAATRRGYVFNPWMAAAAALFGLICIGSGFFAGRISAPVQTVAAGDQREAIARDSSMRTFLLLLEEYAWPPAAPLRRAGYGPWAQTLANEGRYVGAQKLTDEPGFRVERDSQVVRPDGAVRPPNVSGWYLVRAKDYEEAIQLAERGPHLRYGSILVRQIQ